MSQTVRAMRWQDLPEVHRIEAASFPQDAWSQGTFWAELAARPRRDYVVLEDERVLGYGGLDLGGETADVMTIAVDPVLRGQALGTVLLERLVDRAAAAGATQVMLEARADNEAAIRLYDRHGFAEVHRRRGYYPPGGLRPSGTPRQDYRRVDALIMRKEVVARG
ncbi:ribosomal protein S18-alanine N-acetyltransferase [Ornithinimicrobium faecis]|uniref:Ribosomal protein S18-alanine N-acetyltransferase n=1 Tax=Ornithinimicrobium faecis TaxID=2934158 RepID=A0ABY4YPZ8_9MICO|nr:MULTISPECIES: ribosomal protein S18-alanine N-acetyltransferase [unclassified Ornithinimicrobium]USQ78826.1 ribosomal protein S18-alanine N-acetyltransferase [Ornithinimicrobium sp. HY1793]